MSLNYSGNGRLVWQLKSDTGGILHNQLSSVAAYHDHAVGWLCFDQPGKHRLTIQLLEGDFKSVNLAGVVLQPVEN